MDLIETYFVENAFWEGNMTLVAEYAFGFVHSRFKLNVDGKRRAILQQEIETFASTPEVACRPDFGERAARVKWDSSWEDVLYDFY